MQTSRIAQRTEALRLPNGWTTLVTAIALVLAIPVLTVLSSVFANAGEVWSHLASTVLPTYITNSLWLMLGVGVGVTVIGTGTAWLVTMCRFPGSGLLEWGLLLPLAAPAYILAYTYTELLEFYGPVQTALRTTFGWESVSDYWFPNVRSLGGAVVMLTLVLYPYVYLLARSAFLTQSVCTLEASRSLGCGPWRSFFRVALPLARPAIAAGLSLALMETLNDYATVQFFSVDTFTTGIYRTWFGMGERLAASQLAACLLGFVLVLVLLEQWSRGQARYYQPKRYQELPTHRLRGARAIAAWIVCGLPIVLGLLLPAGLLVQMMLSPTTSDSSDDFASAANPNDRLWEFASNSLILALLTAAIAVVIAVILAYGRRLRPNFGMRLATQTAALGYAVPGSVIAVGTLFPLGGLDNAIDAWMKSTFGIATGLLLSGTIMALVFAYLVRFLAVSFNSIDASLVGIKPSLDDAARSLGLGTTQTLLRIHAPLLGSGLFTAAVLVFVDVMKELPATLIVRPFNFDTLAVRVYNLASDERLAEAAAPALAIVLVGLLPVILLSMQISQSRRARQVKA
ncbi:iron ABC transporter permease [Leptolyngbya sp. FACHB-36]|uniref:ABC transporter permease n=1 Tax=Leptolyngbya sp. FACHB-36 TaxID=2692808 RepID=UPI0016801033|nr:iron ABC transporter permease [Leptolyngbya sp. FACHB-36]MBD2021292.1 iron ABC transporter permease [Leptolyngbya sp. FACHB-36]